GVSIGNLAWTGDRLDFALSALSQSVDGSIDVGDQSVRIEVRLPLLLALFAEKVKKSLGKEGTLLLTKK
uniref:polyhydroxyalkanoic acid system family protein n=2 Tax=Pseudomonadota TaxID=1224 RepID=UPI001954426E